MKAIRNPEGTVVIVSVFDQLFKSKRSQADRAMANSFITYAMAKSGNPRRWQERYAPMIQAYYKMQFDLVIALAAEQTFEEETSDA